MEALQENHVVININIDVNTSSDVIEECSHRNNQSDEELEPTRSSLNESESGVNSGNVKESVCCVSEMDLELGVVESKLHLETTKVVRDCRICHMGLDSESEENGVAMELGCCCKDDLAFAHRQCAETWFKIKGNKTCEICCSLARNVSGANEAEQVEQMNEANEAVVPTAAAPTNSLENRNFWQGHRFLNFLLACMVFAFVISWLFHFNVPS